MFNPTNPAHIRRRAEEPLTQLRAATTLVALVQEDAPAVDWTLYDDGRRLEGQLTAPGSDVDRRAAIAAWQRILGAGPVASSSHAGAEHIRVTGSYEGVPVRVVTIVSASVNSGVAA